MIEVGLTMLAKASTPTIAPERWYADTLPDKCDYPAGIVRAAIGGRNAPTFDGPGLQTDRYQFDFAGLTRAAVRDAREALIVAFDQFAGNLPSGDRVELIEYIQPLSLPFDSDKKVYWCGAEFYVHYNRVS